MPTGRSRTALVSNARSPVLPTPWSNTTSLPRSAWSRHGPIPDLDTSSRARPWMTASFTSHASSKSPIAFGRKRCAGNAVRRHVCAVDSSVDVVHRPGASAVLYGVSGLVVVVEDGVVLVTTVDKPSDLKTLMDALPRGVRERS